ncbi:SDR family NAD(P)-dependent oxidoreductase [Schlesneria sp.]|uniref:SDR family NAD(P)-dependent oxidoreductase n=1 Tax=Schlesneria sp. TaxID=2762018 RepID=UPI002EFE14CA
MNRQQSPNELSATQPPLAIVGISALFPKAASTEEFWSNIRRGVDAITEVPASHWSPDEYFDPNQKTPDMTYARRGGFLSPLAFDPLEFGISPNNLEAIDTSQLLGMVGAKRALEDAGYGAGRKFDRSRVGCILGVTGTLEMVIPLGARLGHPRWRKALKDAGVADDVANDVVERISQSYVPWQENSFPGLLGNVVAGRIANRLDLHGTNCVVDAACASSLSAIHLAALELWTGRSDMVVTGGIDTFNDIFMFMCFSKTPALSPTGDSKPFSDEADGTILGEGVGMVVLKRLADAQRDGDRVYAVLKGIGTSSDGAGSAVYAPKAEGQIRCLKDAYRVAGVSPDTIELVEAHGTGTKVGDATEVTGLIDVFKSSGRQGTWCAVGSVKSQIGHTKAAAGAAGVLKAVLALRHRVLPPTIKVNRPPAAMLEPGCPFYVNTEARPWLKSDKHPRRAGVSAFGFGGSNFHCVLEESPQQSDEAEWDGDVQVIALSAPSVNDLLGEVRTKMGSLDGSDWRQVRGLGAASRSQFRATDPHRILFVVERDKTDLKGVLASAQTMFERAPEKANWSTPDGVHYGRGAAAGKLGMLFPGQGSQYVGMLRELACRFPVMLDVLAEANEVFANSVTRNDQAPQDERLTDLIYPYPAFSPEGRSRQDSVLRSTQIAQPAIGAVSLAALAVLDQFGVHPEAVAGHSYGELTALCASQRFGSRALYRLSMLRGTLMAAAQEVDGGMLALGAPLTQIEAALKELSVDLVVANHNSPTQVVLSGRVPEIERATELFARRNIRGKKLSVAAAFHSPLVASASRAFRPVLDEVEFAPSRMPVYANSTAAEYPADPNAARDLLAAQLARPVNFVSEVERMHADGVRTFLEVGPGGVLTGLVNSILQGREYRAVAIDSSGGKRSGVVDLANALAQVSSVGHSVRWDRWDPNGKAASAQSESRRMTVPITGANYVKPRAPIPPRSTAVSVETPRQPEQPPHKDSKGSATIAPLPVAETPTFPQPTPQAIVTPRAAVPSVPSPVPAAAPVSSMSSEVSTPMKSTRPAIAENLSSVARKSPDASSLATIQQLLEAMQRIQTETTRLHQQFLEGQEIAFKTFERLALGQFGGEMASKPAPISPRPADNRAPLVPTRAEQLTMEAPVTATVQPPVARTVTSEPRPAKVELPLPAAAPLPPAAPPAFAAQPKSVTPQVSQPSVSASVAAQSAPAQQFKAAPEAKPVPVSAPQDEPAARSQPNEVISRLGATVLAVVSEKTGYPTEMLNLEMSLDHDLGIDSIKRVEILATLQERVTDLPSFQPDELGALHTLRDVVILAEARTSSALPTSPAVGQPTTVPMQELAPVETPLPQSRLTESSGSDLASPLGQTVLEIVSEKTGYPTEMLNLEMSLDHDLGIDSIKRVEILSALQERVPDLPAFQSDELGALHTLSDVVGLAQSRSADGKPQVAVIAPLAEPIEAAVPQTPNVSSAVSAPAPAASSSGSLLGPVVLAIVSEKTGYPTEMLNLEMSLDHDLGIDSIKRVEILSALQERIPDLPAFQPDELGALHTLKDVVTLAENRSGGSGIPSAAVAEKACEQSETESVPATAVSPGNAINLLLGPVVLEVVSEKTGYPAEMLNLDMSLDHDLGIDSIKRVEILSALQERVPNLPAFQPEELGALHTLRDVVTLADARTNSSRGTAPQTTGPVGATASSVNVTPPATQKRPASEKQGSLELAPIVLAVVSEKTGYPSEMLNLEMSLDHDLGIDSIKRVEILSALQERVLDLPAFQPDELGSLHTLRDVVTLADARTKGASVSAASADVTVTPANSIAAPVEPLTSVKNESASLWPIVLEVVSEKTGYPTEMLHLTMSLDHDLGIDSIKRVEILSAVQERVPDLPAFQPDELGALQTLHDIVSLAEARVAASSTAVATLSPVSHAAVNASAVVQVVPSPAPAPVTERPLAERQLVPSPRIQRSVVRPVALAAASARQKLKLMSGGEVWVTNDGSDLAAKVASELAQQGFRTRLIELENSVLPEVPETLAGLVVIASAGGTTDNQLWSAVRWLQQVGPVLRRNSRHAATFLVTVSRLDGRFGFAGSRPLQNPVSGGLAGLAKCVAREWPDVVARAFDLSHDWSSNQVAAAMLVAELVHEGPVEVGITPSGLFSLEIAEQTLTGVLQNPPIDRGDLVVISGGARGVTAEAAFAMAQAWKPRIAILGRSPEPAPEPEWLARLTTEAEIRQAVIARAVPGSTPKVIGHQVQQIVASREIAQQLHRLASVGISAAYYSVDVRDEQAVKKILSQLEREHGPVRGIIHGAGVLADQKIEDKTKEQFDRVYGTKIDGLNALLKGVDPEELKLLCLFSSYTARFGRVGQLDYGIANEVLNKQARQFAIQHPQCRVASFNWGPWDGGMVQGGLKKLFASEGVGLIPLRDGAEALVFEFQQATSLPVEVLILAPVEEGAAAAQKSATRADPAQAPALNGVSPTGGNASRKGQDVVAPPQSFTTDSPAEMKIDFERELDLSKYSFLESHALGGKAVFPVAMILEWLAHAAIHRNPGLELRGFSDFRVYQGIRLGAHQKYSIKALSGKAVRRGDVFVVPVQLLGERDGREVLHAGANVVLAASYPAAPGTTPPLEGAGYPMNLTDAYERRLFHGPMLRGLQTIEACSEQGITVTTRTAPAPWSWMTDPVRGSWLADPLVIDGALQAIILWSQEFRGKPCLPCAVKNYQQFRRTFPKDGVRIVIRMHEAAAQLVRCDVDFVDLDGVLVARMEGCESVADASLTSAFANNRPE